MPGTLSLLLDSNVAGAVNLRDLGGLPVAGGTLRPGVVYRSGMMHHITPEGLTALADSLRVRTIVDLRNEMELANDGVSDFASAGIRHRHIPVINTGVMISGPERAERIRQLLRGQGAMGAMYIEMVKESGGTFRQFFEVLAEQDSLSVVFHCSGGRDRTGVASALLLSALGAEDEVVGADYAQTGPILRSHSHRFTRSLEETGLTLEEITTLVGDTRPEAILGVLEFLRAEYGSVEGYLESTGLDLAVIEELRGQLVA